MPLFGYLTRQRYTQEPTTHIYKRRKEVDSLYNPDNFRDMIADNYDHKTNLKVQELSDDQIIELIEDHVIFEDIALIIANAYASAAYQLENEE